MIWFLFVVVLCNGICHSVADLDIETPNCTLLYDYLDTNSTQTEFSQNLETMKIMMAASQYSGKNQTREMDIEGIILLFNCLRENVHNNTLIKVPTDLAVIIHNMFVLPYIRTHKKYTSFNIRAINGNGDIRLNVTCKTKSSITMPVPLTLLCDFGDENDDDDDSERLKLLD